jgi:hypothetical protein
MESFNIKEAKERLLKEEIYDFSEVDTGYDEDDNSLLYSDYTFKTPKNKYKVSFYSGEYSPEDKTFEVSFGIDKETISQLDTHEYTGEGDVYNIIQTICKIMEDFLYQYDDDAEKLVIKPTDEKRRKVYKVLIPKYLDPSYRSQIEIK